MIRIFVLRLRKNTNPITDEPTTQSKNAEASLRDSVARWAGEQLIRGRVYMTMRATEVQC